MQRAKRVIITGDPKQLKHVSFLSRTRQEMAKQKHGITGCLIRVDARGSSLI